MFVQSTRLVGYWQKQIPKMFSKHNQATSLFSLTIKFEQMTLECLDRKSDDKPLVDAKIVSKCFCRHFLSTN